MSKLLREKIVALKEKMEIFLLTEEHNKSYY